MLFLTSGSSGISSLTVWCVLPVHGPGVGAVGEKRGDLDLVRTVEADTEVELPSRGRHSSS